MGNRVITSAAVALALGFGLTGLTACGSSGSDGSDGGGESTTTEVVEPERPAYEDRGPYEVGTYLLALDDGRRVEAWYPAEADAVDQPVEIFDIASLLSPDLQSKIDPELRPAYEIDAHVGATAASDDGPYPVVLFSHGYAGFPEQSADLVTHLASWGFVVIAPDHVERSLSGLLGTAGQGVEPREGPEVLSASLDAAIADSDDESSPLHALMDVDQVAVAGHSAGAGAAYREASADDRIDGFIAYSVGLGGGDGTAELPPVPDVPGMVMAGTADGVISSEATREVYDGMDTPKYLVEIADAGHLVFSDICLIGREQGGLVALVAAAGLDLPENLLRLASDGCEEDALDPAEAFAAIDHFSVAFLRSTFGIDPEPVGLDPEVADQFDTAEVTLVADPGE